MLAGIRSRGVALLVALALIACGQEGGGRDHGGEDARGDAGEGAGEGARGGAGEGARGGAGEGAGEGAREGRSAGGTGSAAVAAETVVEVWFRRGEEPVAVRRRVARATAEAALEALVRGPIEAERRRGVTSWFSAATQDVVREVDFRDGLLVVDFRDLPLRIPGASSSAGSAALLASLDSTVFQFPAVDSVRYRLDGSARGFYEWLQRAPETRRRAGARPGTADR